MLFKYLIEIIVKDKTVYGNILDVFLWTAPSANNIDVKSVTTPQRSVSFKTNKTVSNDLANNSVFSFFKMLFTIDLKIN